MDKQPARHLTLNLRLISATLLLLVAFNIPASTHFPLPENHQSTYSIVKYGAEVAELKNTFQYLDQQIIYTSEATTTGAAAIFYKEVITETSQLNWTNSDLSSHPQQTSYVLQHKKNKARDQRINFEWPTTDQTTISSTYKNKTTTLSSKEAVWSSQLIPILMSHDLLKNEASTDKNFLIANKGQLNNYYYTFEGYDKITLNGTTHACLKFKINKQDRQRFSYAWLSKEHFYLPLQIEQHDDGELTLSMTLKHFELLK